MGKQIDTSGIWYLAYWYPSNDHEGDDISEYDGRMSQSGTEPVFESDPNSEGSYMFARFSVADNLLLTGTWHESTAPNGAFKGMLYNGAGQLLFDAEQHQSNGSWAGAGIDHESGDKPKIYTGRWEIRQVAP